MTIDQAAGLAEMSVRSLQRRLATHGSTFARVSEQTRAELALQMLDRTDLTPGEIASELGYSERTNFVRAFKRWTGVTPEQFRTQSANTFDDDPVA
jgi:AraC-like DNA-binding protein